MRRQKTSSLQALHRAETSGLHGGRSIHLFKTTPCRGHGGTHRAAHRSEPCELGGIVKKVRSENERGDEVVGKAGDGLARVSIAAAVGLFLSHARFLTGHCVGRQSGWSCVRARMPRTRGMWAPSAFAHSTMSPCPCFCAHFRVPASHGQPFARNRTIPKHHPPRNSFFKFV
jgi:hypothetical protein